MIRPLMGFINILAVLYLFSHTWLFDFGKGEVEDGFTGITPQSEYTSEKGYGLVVSHAAVSGGIEGDDPLTCDWITSEKPFYFKVDLPEGRYRINLTLGNQAEATATTVKAESRRLMLENINTSEGEVVTRSIIVDVRTPRINDSEYISLKSREIGFLNWDNSLSLEFNGPKPCVSSIIIEEANDLPVIFLAGNSTVTDQESEPWASWGQMLPRFLKPGIAVANYAESGETLRAFRRENRLKKILSIMKQGDYLFIEFAHNDQKPGRNHVDPYASYTDELRIFINEARRKGGVPVLVTPVHRRQFDENGEIINSLGDYPEAMRQLAEKENLHLIDLNAMSRILFETLGTVDSKKAFVHYPANTFPNQARPLEDNTHFNAYGAYQLAKCVVQGLIDNKMDLADLIVDDFKPYNPAEPDDWRKKQR